MKYRQVKLLLGVGLTLWLLVFPAYLHFTALDEADFLSPSQAWENVDLLELTAGFPKIGKIIGGGTFLILLIFLAIFSARPPDRPGPGPDVTRNMLGLRC